MMQHSPTNIATFTPPERILMGPGPSNVHPRVLAALGAPTIGHLDPEFISMMEELKILLQYAFQTQNALTSPVSAPGSAGMESCFVNLVEPGDQVVVCRNGVFGGRMQENVRRSGGIPIVIDDPWGCPIDPQKLEDIRHYRF
jgi:alanine-glyoxylate transaminase/serine-glyoxylate transaminase/serine-pyruvate transaminase